MNPSLFERIQRYDARRSSLPGEHWIVLGTGLWLLSRPGSAAVGRLSQGRPAPAPRGGAAALQQAGPGSGDIAAPGQDDVDALKRPEALPRVQEIDPRPDLPDGAAPLRSGVRLGPAEPRLVAVTIDPFSQTDQGHSEMVTRTGPVRCRTKGTRHLG
jgi:hypothetical protein